MKHSKHPKIDRLDLRPDTGPHWADDLGALEWDWERAPDFAYDEEDENDG